MGGGGSLYAVDTCTDNLSANGILGGNNDWLGKGQRIDRLPRQNDDLGVRLYAIVASREQRLPERHHDQIAGTDLRVIADNQKVTNRRDWVQGTCSKLKNFVVGQDDRRPDFPFFHCHQAISGAAIAPSSGGNSCLAKSQRLDFISEPSRKGDHVLGPWERPRFTVERLELIVGGKGAVNLVEKRLVPEGSHVLCLGHPGLTRHRDDGIR